jgi:hypothetical protein
MIATFISRSGGWMSAMSPHSNRERSRSSSVGISFGSASEVRTICFCASCSALNVWKKLLLRRVLPGDELHVVHQQHVELPVAPLELMHPLEAQGVDQVVQEALGRQVQHARVGLAAQHLLSDRVHQVRLAEADAAVQEERVVGARRRLGDRARGRVRELVRGAHDERIEGEARAQDEGARRRRRGRAGGQRQGSLGVGGLETDRESRISRRLGLAREQLAMARLDPVREDPGRDRYGELRMVAFGGEAELASGPEQVLSSLASSFSSICFRMDVQISVIVLRRAHA